MRPRRPVIDRLRRVQIHHPRIDIHPIGLIFGYEPRIRTTIARSRGSTASGAGMLPFTTPRVACSDPSQVSDEPRQSLPLTPTAKSLSRAGCPSDLKNARAKVRLFKWRHHKDSPRRRRAKLGSVIIPVPRKLLHQRSSDPNPLVQLLLRIVVHHVQLYVFIPPTLARFRIRLPQQVQLRPRLRRRRRFCHRLLNRQRLLFSPFLPASLARQRQPNHRSKYRRFSGDHYRPVRSRSSTEP